MKNDRPTFAQLIGESKEVRDKMLGAANSHCRLSSGSVRLAVGDVVEYELSNGRAYHVTLANVESVEIARESLMKGDCKKVMPAAENTEVAGCEPATHTQRTD